MFWQGLIIGVFVGANVGIVVAALIASAKRQNHADNDNPELQTSEYAVMKDETDFRQNSPSFSSHDRKLKNDLERPVPSGEACINRP